MNNLNQIQIISILNITPNSFSGDGILDVKKIEEAIEQSVKYGADIIDIGAESTAPGSEKISVEEEIKRLEPVFEIVKKIQKNFSVQFALDTVNAETAARGIDAGCTMINDVSGGRNDEKMFELIAKTKVKYVLMYCKNATGRADLEVINEDVLKSVFSFFDTQIEKAMSVGIQKDQIVLDPGMGAFISPKSEDSLKILQNIPELKKRYNLPVYIGASRKGFLSQLTDYDFGARNRVGSSLAVALYAAQQGASFLRVHDVLETRQFFDVALTPTLSQREREL